MVSAAALPSRSLAQAPAIAGPIVLLGRLFFVLIFLMAGPNHFSGQTIAYSASQGVPLLSADSPSCSATAPGLAPGSLRSSWSQSRP
jgi:uncharacterized membrane protein YphA (DoxX/SURF4 family)